jgi:hypothetical protein
MAGDDFAARVSVSSFAERVDGNATGVSETTASPSSDRMSPGRLDFLSE